VSGINENKIVNYITKC